MLGGMPVDDAFTTEYGFYLPLAGKAEDHVNRTGDIYFSGVIAGGFGQDIVVQVDR